ncbi:MAG TPA: hypothetical protein VGE07_17290 [Herpetosiphonaceae bacterium]
MDALEERMLAIRWRYADQDPVALGALEDRIAAAGRAGGLLTYAELVEAMVFKLPGVRGGAPFQIVTFAWSSLDRRLVNEFLGLIGVRSYQLAGFMANALVIDRAPDKPAMHFAQWLRQIRARPKLDEAAILAYWREQVDLAHQFYQAEPAP